MGLKAENYYSIECDHLDCGIDTGELGDFSAYLETATAIEHWEGNDGQHVPATALGPERFYCDRHRIDTCEGCDGPLHEGSCPEAAWTAKGPIETIPGQIAIDGSVTS